MPGKAVRSHTAVILDYGFQIIRPQPVLLFHDCQKYLFFRLEVVVDGRARETCLPAYVAERDFLE